MALDLVETKIVASVVLFGMTLLCGYLPARFILNQAFVEYAMFAGGGVLMATAFCHLIPEAHDSYRQKYPHSHHHDSHQDDDPSHHHHQHNLTNQILHNLTSTTTTPIPISLSNTTSTAIANLITTTTTPNSINSTITDNILAQESGIDPNVDVLVIPYLEICLCSGFFFMYIVEQLMMRFINTHTHEHPCDSSTGQLVSGQSVVSLNDQGDFMPSSNHSENPSSQGIIQSGHLYKFLRGFLIISAFLLHSIFEGVNIGSQPTAEKVWTFLFAISCHKLIVAAVVGLEIYATTLESKLWTLIHMTLFSLMSPIGILLVVIAQETLHLDENSPTMILIQSFATGTILYIVFVEILQHDRRGGKPSRSKNKFGKSIALIGGFAMMLLILILTDEH